MSTSAPAPPPPPDARQSSSSSDSYSSSLNPSRPTRTKGSAYTPLRLRQQSQTTANHRPCPPKPWRRKKPPQTRVSASVLGAPMSTSAPEPLPHPHLRVPASSHAPAPPSVTAPFLPRLRFFRLSGNNRKQQQTIANYRKRRVSAPSLTALPPLLRSPALNSRTAR